MDRLAPTRRPNRPVVMRQQWRRLLFAHWEVDPGPLAARLPPGLQLDTFEGRAFVGLVPSTMQGVRPRFVPPVPWLSAFPEVNVRTYVHVDGRDPGVFFFSLDAARALAVLGARAGFGLPYFWARMRSRLEDHGWVAYASERLAGPKPATLRARYRSAGRVRAAEPGGLEHFLIERYLLYATQLGRLVEGQVHHRPYPVEDAELDGLEETLLAASGIARGPQAPLLHYAEGVDVEVFGLRRVKRSAR